MAYWKDKDPFNIYITKSLFEDYKASNKNWGGHKKWNMHQKVQMYARLYHTEELTKNLEEVNFISSIVSSCNLLLWDQLGVSYGSIVGLLSYNNSGWSMGNLSWTFSHVLLIGWVKKMRNEIINYCRSKWYRLTIGAVSTAS